MNSEEGKEATVMYWGVVRWVRVRARGLLKAGLKVPEIRGTAAATSLSEVFLAGRNFTLSCIAENCVIER